MKATWYKIFISKQPCNTLVEEVSQKGLHFFGVCCQPNKITWETISDKRNPKKKGMGLLFFWHKDLNFEWL